VDFNNNKDLVNLGFKGFKTVKELWQDKTVIPKERGVYLVLNPQCNKPQFMYPGVGGHFKGKDPNVPLEELKQNHVKDSKVIYIGKAGSLTGKATLFSRLGQYLRFGQTKNIGHWGGRYIWQLKNHEELIFCWCVLNEKDPRDVEKVLLHLYQQQFGQRPFANLTG